MHVRARRSLGVASQPNMIWALDFLSDALYGSRQFWTLNVLDEGVREGLAIEEDTSLPANRLTRVLEQVIRWRGTPQAFGVEKRPGATCRQFSHLVCAAWDPIGLYPTWAPAQSAFIERFNRTYRTEVLNVYVFGSLEQVQEIT